MGNKALIGDPKDDGELDFGVAVVVVLLLSTLGQRVELDIREVWIQTWGSPFLTVTVICPASC